jgi:hypothetical protein
MPLKNLPYLFALLSVIAAAQSYRTQGWTLQERAVLAVFVALTAALPPLLSGRAGPRWWVRSCLVSAHRLMAFTVPMEASVALSQLQLQPSTGGLGAAVDAIHVLIGERGRRTAAISAPASPPPYPAAARRRQSRPARGHWPAAVACSGISVHVCTPLPLIAGSRGLRLLLFGVGLPLDLPSHLVVHTLCLATSLASLPHACTQQVRLKHDAPASLRHPACRLACLPACQLLSWPAVCLACLRTARQHSPHLPGCKPCLPPFLLQLLDNPLTGGRIAAFHRLMGVGMGGLLPIGYPPGGKHVECTSALVFMCGFLGWVLPTYAVLRRHCREARKEATKTAAEAAELAAAAAAAAAEAPQQREPEQPAQAALAGCDTATSDPPGTAAAGVLSAGGAQGSRQSAALLRHPRMDATAAWLLSNIVLAGAPLEHRVTSWCILAVLCWLASTVVAVRVIA